MPTVLVERRAVFTTSPQRAIATLALTLAWVLLAACRPEIGDACINDLECGTEQVCDTSVPRGYCTRYDCEPSSCPDEAVCVDFQVLTACMERCSSDSDCRGRGGYVCRQDIGPVGFCYQPAVDGAQGPPSLIVDGAPSEGSASEALDGSGEGSAP